MDTKALNEKLLKFAGFTFTEKPLPKGKSYKEWKYPESYGYLNQPGVPDLVNSLDAQAKWIYPKLAQDYRIDKIYHPITKVWAISLSHLVVGAEETLYSPYDESESVAFALVVEKLIDSMEKHD